MVLLLCQNISENRNKISKKVLTNIREMIIIQLMKTEIKFPRMEITSFDS